MTISLTLDKDIEADMMSKQSPIPIISVAKLRNSVGFQFGFFQYSGLSEEKAIDHICNAADRYAKEATKDNKRLTENLYQAAKKFIRIADRDTDECNALRFAIAEYENAQLAPVKGNAPF